MKILKDEKYKSTRLWIGVVTLYTSALLLVVFPGILVIFGKVSGADWVGMAKVFGLVVGIVVPALIVGKSIRASNGS